jgi:hypothetical protein
MNWEAIGAVAELAGAVAVIATLVYLSIQLRQNSKLLSASLATSNRESTNQLTGLLATDREALGVFWAGVTGRDNLEELDRQHFDALISLYFEALLQSYQQDYVEGLARADWMLAQPGIIQFWQDYSILYDPGFKAYMSGRIKTLHEGQPPEASITASARTPS